MTDLASNHMITHVLEMGPTARLTWMQRLSQHHTGARLVYSMKAGSRSGLMPWPCLQVNNSGNVAHAIVRSLIPATDPSSTCAQADIVHELNDALGTDYEVELGWQDMLPEPPSQPGSDKAGANGHNGAATLLGGDLPSEDESDFSFRSAALMHTGRS